MSTVLDIIADAMQEIGTISAGEAPSSVDAAYVQRKLNALLDEWSSRKVYAYAVVFSQFTLIPNHAPHTIGQGAAISNTALAGNLATYTASNNFKPGDFVSVSGTTNGGGAFNVTNQPVQSCTSTQFVLAINHADIATHADTGSAWPAANPLPDYLVFQRPQRIEGANLIFTNSPTNVDTPIQVRDADWWNNQRVKSLTSNVPTDVYYSPAFPNGELNFWPVPNFAYGVRLELWTLLQFIANLTDTFSLPPAYQKAITLTLAEEIAPSFNQPIHPQTALSAQRARTAVQMNNDKSPRMVTTDSGQPMASGPAGKRGDFDWISGRLV
jgi:hypothetical protein